MASIIEQILDRVEAALVGAGLVNGRVSRGREDAWGEDELPAINIRRTATETLSHSNGLDRTTLGFDIDHLELDAQWETAADALHMLTHTVLSTDAPLSLLGHGLRCVGTEAIGASSDYPTARLVAHYQIQFITRPSDLTRAIN